MRSAGIDIGSRTIEVVIMVDGEIVESKQTDSGFDPLKQAKEIQISSMCTVFAESEVTCLVAKEEDRQDIALGVHQSVVQRAVSMLKRVNIEDPTLFAGGVARNPCMCRLLEQALEREVLVPEDPQMVRALGAAILATQR